MKTGKLLITALSLLGLSVTVASAATTLQTVKAKGHIQCGVTTGLAGFSAPDDKGVYSGIDADVCYAVAAAVFGDKNKVKFTPSDRQGTLHSAGFWRNRHSVA